MSTLAEELTVRITDPVLLKYLEPLDPPERPAKLQEAARVGFVVLEAASGTLDAQTVEKAFENAQSKLDETLKDYFKEKSGQMHRILDSMLGERGELSRKLETWFGPEAGKVGQLLRERLGPGSAFEKSLDLGNDQSALAKLKAHFEERHNELTRLLHELKGRKETEEKTTVKGGDFEKAVYDIVAELGKGAGDVTAHVGEKVGSVRNSKKGDYQVTVGESGRLVLEAKKDRSYDLEKSKAELQEAKANRQAQIGIFIYSKGYEPKEVGDFRVVDRDLYCTVAEGEPPIYLEAAYRIARATLALESVEETREKGDLLALLERAKGEVNRLVEDHERAVKAQAAVEDVVKHLGNRQSRLKKDLAAMEDALRRGKIAS